MGTTRRIAAALGTVVCTVAAFPPTATAWAPAGTATIHPGVQLVTAAGQCTANFVFTGTGGAVYIGMAAHCAGTGGLTDLNGCTTGSLLLGTPVQIQGASQPGTMAYSSWLTMQAGETDANACRYNDFALVRVASADVARVNPSMPHWGGPAGGLSPGTALGQQVFSYGNSSIRQGLALLSPKTGVSLGSAGGGWTHTVYTATPGIPGDSGSGYLDSQGRALGVLSSIGLVSLPLSNGVSDLSRALAYANTRVPTLGVALASGTEPFNPGRLPIGL